ncbi:MAG: efflux RND transporter periplasmic adaptor subunit, partial [Planctomycetota bacterium]
RDAYDDDAATKKEVEEAELADIESRVQLRADVLALRALEAIREAARIWPLQVRQVIDKKTLTAAVLEHELAEARAAHVQAVRDRERSVIRAPVDGVVLHRAVSNERMLPAGQLLLEIGDLADLEIAVDVLSQEAMEIAPDDPVDIAGPGLGPDAVRGRVARIEPRGFTKVSSLGVEQQRVWVIIELEPGTLERLAETGRTLGIGYRLRVRIHTDRRLETVVIPRAALFRGPDDGWRTFVVRGGRARLADLQVGLMNDREVEVLRGVETGEAVVVAPPAGLADGTRVRARDRASP